MTKLTVTPAMPGTATHYPNSQTHHQHGDMP